MKIRLTTILAATFLLIAGVLPAIAQNGGTSSSSSSQSQAGSGTMEYKLVSGYKQPFNDDLKYQTSKGWVPVGGVSVTSWNNDLFFAQLVGRPVGSGQ
jgi:hypothetical protein